MRIYEIIAENTEAMHHSLTPWQRVDHGYELAYDTHGLGRAGERSISTRDLVGLVAYSFAHNRVRDIPRGTSSYIHDTRTGNSIVLERLKSYPFRFIIRSAMDPSRPPGNPVISVHAPPATLTKSQENFFDMFLKNVGDAVRDRGINAVSQDLEQGQHFMPMNRELRRRLERKQKSKR